MRHLLTFVLAAFLCAFAISPVSAGAEGGNSIAAAAPITPGVQEFGNTGNNPRVGGRLEAFWSLVVTAGDRVTIDWEASDQVEFAPYPIGTTDFTVEQTQPSFRQYPKDNGKNEMRLKESQTGTLPFMLSSPRPSTYSFTAYVQHSLSLSLPRTSGLRHHGVLDVGVHNPEGEPISDPALSVELQLRRGSRWVTIGAAAVAESNAAVSYRVPHRFWGRRLPLRAVAAGAAYIAAHSQSHRVRVKR